MLAMADNRWHVHDVAGYGGECPYAESLSDLVFYVAASGLDGMASTCA